MAGAGWLTALIDTGAGLSQCRRLAAHGTDAAEHSAHHERPAAVGYARLLRLPRHPYAGTGRSGGRRGAVRALLRERHHPHAEPRLHADRQAAAGARRVTGGTTAHFSAWAAERAIAFLGERDPARPFFST